MNNIRPWLQWLIPAVIISFALTIINVAFFPVLVLSLCILFSINYIINTWAAIKAAKAQKEFELKQLEELSKQGATMACSYCNHEQYVPLRFDADNEFVCDNCDKTNAVYLTIKPTQTTTPVNTDASIAVAKATETISTSNETDSNTN